ncbi:hypothetical protein, partial [Paenibacillus residui]|uniref:hypothetical protein n=1 Tax=Paenibacillus residui TaxID=629724 RepID=UPI0036D3A2E1
HFDPRSLLAFGPNQNGNLYPRFEAKMPPSQNSCPTLHPASNRNFQSIFDTNLNESHYAALTP